MQNSTVNDDLISATVAAAMVGVCPGTLRDWDRRGYFMRPLAFGGRLAYSRSAVAAWLASPDRAPPPHGKARVGDGHHRAYPKEFMAQAIKMNTDGVSYDRIAKVLGVSKGAVAKWCTGKRRNMHPDDVVARAKAKRKPGADRERR